MFADCSATAYAELEAQVRGESVQRQRRELEGVQLARRLHRCVSSAQCVGLCTQQQSAQQSDLIGGERLVGV